MRHVILSLMTVLGLSAQAAHAEEAQEVSSETEISGQLDERVGAEHARYGQWVFLGCVANEYQCQAIGARRGFRFRTVQQNRAYCGGGYPGGGYPGGGYPGGGYPGGGYPGGGYPGGGYPGGWGGGGHHGGGYPGGWGGGGHHGGGYPGGGYPGGWGGGGHHRPGGHHRGRVADFAANDSVESIDNDETVDGARFHGGRFAGFACFGAR
jgi:hypothetical protein